MKTRSFSGEGNKEGLRSGHTRPPPKTHTPPLSTALWALPSARNTYGSGGGAVEMADKGGKWYHPAVYCWHGQGSAQQTGGGWFRSLPAPPPTVLLARVRIVEHRMYEDSVLELGCVNTDPVFQKTIRSKHCYVSKSL